MPSKLPPDWTLTLAAHLAGDERGSMVHAEALELDSIDGPHDVSDLERDSWAEQRVVADMED